MKRIDATDPKTIRYKFRMKRFKRIEKTIRKIAETKDIVTVLDVGGRRDYWNYLSEDLRNKTEITLVNMENELTDYAESVDGLKLIPVIGNGCDMPQFEDQSFDFVHSNSVIEHVGSLENMHKFAKETRRIGKSYYVQAPYLWFPLEPHFGVPFLHWLPGPARAQLTHKFNVGYSEKFEDYSDALVEADGINLVDKTLMTKLFPEGTMYKEKFAALTKSIIMMKPA